MNRRQAMSVLGIAGVSSLSAAPSARDRFPGIYKLISWKSANPDGTVVEPLGPDPIGRITYHKSGHMSVMLMRRDRKTPARVNPLTATIEQMREALQRVRGTAAGFVAYMGTYEVHEERSIVIHHLEGGSSPNMTGADFERRFEFTSKGLKLSAPPNFNAKLEWERVADA